MVKQLLILPALFIAYASSSFAGPFYIVPQLTYQGISADDIKYEGITPGLTIGYGDVAREGMYIAVELVGNYSTYDLNNVTKNGQSLKSKWSWGGSVLPGYFLEQSLLVYLRLGALEARFEEIDEKKWGYQIGLGLEGKLWGCWSIRAEYDYLRFQTMDAIGIGQANMDEVSLGFVYRFDNSDG